MTFIGADVRALPYLTYLYSFTMVVGQIIVLWNKGIVDIGLDFAYQVFYYSL
ncbi:hypothetical protein DJICPGNB_05435 [Escherichia coli]|nr:hypothetical protein DJICPGNB_05435 [Escherichia coli]